ncbi:putative oxidoreductase domain protein [Mycobacterium kansasii]|uniref:Putative oxidoreductase domain protein n=1 Tax=Mycobacterium kansasii TaxID=1768 RepID=A0A1V3W9L1_MYCKA|nr:putative oxidoreductase domain protein [Mycobacterium kansasii]
MEKASRGLVDIGFVAHPQFDRVHAQAVCQIVHGALERKRSGYGAGPS